MRVPFEYNPSKLYIASQLNILCKLTNSKISKAFPSICRYASPLYIVQCASNMYNWYIASPLYNHCKLANCATGIYAGADAHIHRHMRANGHFGSLCCLNMGIG